MTRIPQFGIRFQVPEATRNALNKHTASDKHYQNRVNRTLDWMEADDTYRQDDGITATLEYNAAQKGCEMVMQDSFGNQGRVLLPARNAHQDPVENQLSHFHALLRALPVFLEFEPEVTVFDALSHNGDFSLKRK